MNILRIFLLSILLIALPAFAQEIVPPSQDELMQLFASLGGLAGMKAIAIAAFVVQAVMLLLRSKLSEVLGKYRLLVVYGISIIAGVLSLIASGVNVGAAFVHANTLAAFGVFFNQIYKQFVTKSSS